MSFGLMSFRSHEFFGLLKFWPFEFGLMKIGPYNFRPFVVRTLDGISITNISFDLNKVSLMDIGLINPLRVTSRSFFYFLCL